VTSLLFLDLLIILSSGLFAGIVCRRLGVSMLIGYLVIGAFIGAGGAGIVRGDQHEIKILAEAGVLLLLFSIGLEFSLDDFVKLGRNLLIAGSMQMVLVAAPVYAVLAAWGTTWQAAVMIAVAVAFSSTVLVFKTLSEWGQSASPHGRRAIGILLFQDAALVPLLLLIPLLTGEDKSAEQFGIVGLMLVSAALIATVVVLQTMMARWGARFLARSQSPEIVVLFAVVVVGAVTCGTYLIGLPPAVGAFGAGLILGGNRLTEQIDALMLPFRETFAAVFFVSLGMLFQPAVILDSVLHFAMCLIAIVVLKTFAATIALRITGIAWRPALGTGIGMAHVGEFALMLLMISRESDLLTESTYQQVFALALATLFMTPLLLQLGLRWAGSASPGEIAKSFDNEIGTADHTHSLVIGVGPVGRRVASQLETMGRDVCVIDKSRLNLQAFAQEGFRTVAGDAASPEILQRARVELVDLAIICVPDDEDAVRIVRAVRKLNRECRIIVRCRFQGTIDVLRTSGAEEVVSEERQAAEQIVRLLNL
jgi:CPA2 family monovalent cation:H+ antiporter-2